MKVRYVPFFILTALFLFILPLGLALFASAQSFPSFGNTFSSETNSKWCILGLCLPRLSSTTANTASASTNSKMCVLWWCIQRPLPDTSASTTNTATNTAANTTINIAEINKPCATTCKLFVTTQMVTGESLPGMFVSLIKNDQTVASGSTPITFTVNNFTQYSVEVDGYANYAFAHWLDKSSSANPLPVSITRNTEITAVYSDTDVTLSPPKGPSGTSVSFTGAMFSPNSTVTLSWDGNAVATNPNNVTSSSTGDFTASFQVPSTAPYGSHMIQAIDSKGNIHAAQFTVSPNPSITFDANSANVGNGVRVSGVNFASNSQITISFDGRAIGEGLQDFQDLGTTDPWYVNTDANGTFDAIISVLRSVAGEHSISVQDSSGSQAKQNITVKPHVFIYPTSAHAGSRILVPPSQGNGFAANSTITVEFNGTTISLSPPIVTDTNGNFGAKFNVPNKAPPGTYPLQFADSQGNTFSTSLTVIPSTAPTYKIESVVAGLNLPDAFAFIPDNGPSAASSGALMITEKNSGNVIVFNYTKGQFVRQSVPFVTIPNLKTGYEDNGILGIAFDPNWVKTKLVYFYVTRNVTGVIYGEVVRYHATTDSSGNIVYDKSVGEQLVLGSIPANHDGHNAGHLKFDSSGDLYISAGDGWMWIGQDLTTLEGKILRIAPLDKPSDGKLYSIPITNPFASNPNATIKKEIWAYGIRNPFSFDIDSKTGKIYASDVGYWTWERIDNLTAAGSNVGWPNYEGPMYGNPEHLANYVPQIYWYPHQGVQPMTGPMLGREALTAGSFYHGTYYPNLDGAYFFGDFAVGNIVALLPTSEAAPQIDTASGEPKGQVVPIYYGLANAPINMQEWDGKLYFLDLTGNMDVLNYN
ncbi:MAG: PQQ-dependent sugar dehydrogenase [Thaumarchaeota archaeon]|nr:PQQ-dependent sugar dehydrogenase [Nitrososphaerota archaeon]